MLGHMGAKVWLEGRVVAAEDAKISVFDRGFLYGDAAFESLRVYQGVPFALDLHLERMRAATLRLGFAEALDVPMVRHAVRVTLAAAGLADAYLRIVVTRGAGSPGLAPSAGPSSLVVYVLDAAPYVPPPEAVTTGRHAILVELESPGPRPKDPSLKTTNYLANVLATGAARRAQADDAILLAPDGVHVTEAASANLFAQIDGVWVTPPRSPELLAGITRQLLLELMRAHAVSYVERPLRKDELVRASEIFLTSSLRELMPIVRLGGELVGAGVPGESTMRLLALYRAEVSRQVAQARGL